MYSIGLDLGTSSVKAVLFDGEKVIETASAKYDIVTCRLTDKAEYKGLKAERYKDVVFGVIKELASKVNGDILGISMASASGNTLLVDKQGKPLTDIYSWTASGFENEIKEIYGSLDSGEVAKISGWGFFNTFPLAHLAHIKVHKPQLLESCDKVCMSEGYLFYHMTGKWGIDRSTAVPFYLLEQETGKWHQEYLDKLGISEDKLPSVYESGAFLGNITEEFSALTGINKKCKVYLGSFDHPSGAVANEVFNEGDLLLSCGTSWVCFFPYHDREKILKERLLCDTFTSSENGLWGAMFSIAQISYPIEKMLDKYFDEDDKIKAYNDYSERASRGADGLKINPTTDSDKDFSMYKKENIARALMEGAAELFKTKLIELEKKGFKFTNVKMAGGPSKSKILREIIEYTIGKKVEVTYGVNSGAVGAAKRCIKN